MRTTRFALLLATLALTPVIAQPQRDKPRGWDAGRTEALQRAEEERRAAEAPWTDRLAALDPDDPERYFLLAEEVADRADDPAEVDLARRLFVLAFELDRRRGGASTLAASACIALASLERIEDRAAWLRSLAGAIDERYAATDWNVPAEPEVDGETGLLAAEVLGLTRAGHGRRAQNILDRHPEVLDLLRRYDRMLGTLFPGGGVRQLRDDMRYWPCPECRNDRVIRRSGADPVDYRLCYTCHGNPGPQLTLQQLIAHLRFESRLLHGVQRSWAAQVAVDFGAPIRDPEPEELAPTMQVNPERVLWRDGEWLTEDDVE